MISACTLLLLITVHNIVLITRAWSQEEWRRIADVCEARDAVVIFDTAYQGYARLAI